MAFGFAALAVVGLYAVVSFSVTQRTREIGVRMALGAEPVRIVRLIVSDGGVQLAIGVLGGIGFAGALARMLQTLLFGVKPWDPTVLVRVVATLGTAGLSPA